VDAVQLTAALTAAAAVIGAVTGYLAKAQETRRAARHEAEETAIDGYHKLTGALQARLEVVEQKLLQAEKRICELEAENALLRDQLGTLKSSLLA